MITNSISNNSGNHVSLYQRNVARGQWFSINGGSTGLTLAQSTYDAICE